MNEQIYNVLLDLGEWARNATPEDIENFYYQSFPLPYPFDVENFLFITNSNSNDVIPVFCFDKSECHLARCLNDVYKTGSLIMRTYDGFVVRNQYGTIENIINDQALKIFSSSPVIKVVPKRSVVANETTPFCITNNLNDYIIRKSGKLNITPNGIEYIEKYYGGSHKHIIATPAQMLGLYGNDFCQKLFSFITKETNDPIERMCQEKLKRFFEEELK